jgi:flagellar basal-body rod protein FlgF
MDASTYVALSGQLTLEQRMASLASNIANANTPGFKAGSIDFRTQLTNVGRGGTAFAATGTDTLDMSSGGMTNTGNPLDIAVSGASTLAYQSPQGVYYSRDGRLTMTPEGQLQNMSGHSLLDASNSPVLVNATGGPITVAHNGKISQGGSVVGHVGLFSIDTGAGVTRRENSGIFPAQPPEPVSDFGRNGILQGYVETSNVNPVVEMVHLIELSRAFEAMSTFADKALDAERNAIETLGSR